MNKREKKVVITLLVTALFGASQLIFSSTGNDQARIESQSDITSFVNTIKTDLAKTSLNESEKTVMAHISNTPDNDPFIDTPELTVLKSQVGEKAKITVPKVNVKSSEKSSKYKYTGYFLMDNDKIAIVNGKEYSVGQTIAGSNVVLKDIYSSAIVLQNISDKSKFSVKFNSNNNKQERVER